MIGWVDECWFGCGCPWNVDRHHVLAHLMLLGTGKRGATMPGLRSWRLPALLRMDRRSRCVPDARVWPRVVAEAAVGRTHSQ